ncbi:tol-pal system protein YbgF [Microvirga alba]|uniref:Cell division coordinator CpoB n=1 Tax=Microvirga alba TaxID=2791025 RepID=A0A931FPB4_9HYPH|nr:tol-pal system protein YbgF [Microvirga alba]MBF9234829.1 tol-pal system protein YbgF [Microvirga alba]
MFRRLIVYFAFAAALAAPAAAQDAADAIVRLNRLENQFRQMSGQIEQLQFENRQLKEQLRKFQEDVEFRFQENRGGKASPPATTPPRPAQPQLQRRSDVFEPSETREAPGGPRPLGTTMPSAPLAASNDAGRPLALPGGKLAGIGDLIEEDEVAAGTGPLDLNGTNRAAVVPQPPGAPAGRPGPSVAATSVGDPRSDYETAYAYLAQQQYEQAEMGFRRFLQSNPRDRLVPDAAFGLGETYLQRSRFREAAEQFLNVSTDHPNAARAPEALLKLGVALNGLGARDRACAVFAEVGRKYPQASSNVRQGAEREQKRAKCT